MGTPNKITTIHDSLKALTKNTSDLLEKYNKGEKINTTEEKAISHKFDAISRKASVLLQWRKETGDESGDWFFEEV